jgi:hypothetical protein
MKIIHLSIDDKFLGKEFIPNLRSFVGLEGHHFLIQCDGRPNYPILDKDVSFEYLQRNQTTNILVDLLPFQKLIIHGFTDSMRESVMSIPKTIQVTSIVYGFEYYSKIDTKVDLFKAETKISSNCFIGVNATIGYQIIIGEKNLIGARTLITKNTEPNSVFISQDTEKYRLDSNTFLKLTRL